MNSASYSAAAASTVVSRIADTSACHGASSSAAGLRRLRHGDAELRHQLGVGRRQPQPRQQAVELGAGQFLAVVGGWRSRSVPVVGLLIVTGR